MPAKRKRTALCICFKRRVCATAIAPDEILEPAEYWPAITADKLQQHVLLGEWTAKHEHNGGQSALLEISDNEETTDVSPKKM